MPGPVENEETVREPVQHRPVVGDEEDASVEVREIVFELPDGIKIQVVGGLVQQEEVRRRGQEPHEGEPPKLPARETVKGHAVHGAEKRNLSGTAPR